MAASVKEDECICCGACKDACPVSAIEMVNEKPSVDEATCISCGACADGCPAGAITV